MTASAASDGAAAVNEAMSGAQRAGQWLAAVVKGLIGAGVLVLCYQLVHWSGVVDSRVLPSVVAILAEMLGLMTSAEFLWAIFETVWPALIIDAV